MLQLILQVKEKYDKPKSRILLSNIQTSSFLTKFASQSSSQLIERPDCSWRSQICSDRGISFDFFLVFYPVQYIKINIIGKELNNSRNFPEEK